MITREIGVFNSDAEKSVFDKGSNSQTTVPDQKSLGVTATNRVEADRDKPVFSTADALTRDCWSKEPPKPISKGGLGTARRGVRQRDDDYQRRRRVIEDRIYRDTTKYEHWRISPHHVSEADTARRYGVPLNDFARWRQNRKDFPQPSLELNVPGSIQVVHLWHVLHLTTWERRHAVQKRAEVQKRDDDRKLIKLETEKSGRDITWHDFPPTVGPPSVIELWTAQAQAELRVAV